MEGKMRLFVIYYFSLIIMEDIVAELVNAMPC